MTKTMMSTWTWESYIRCICCICLISLPYSSAVKNLEITVSELCTKSEKHNFLSNIPKPIDGAVVISSNERDVDCVVTFQTESILERFMIRFDDLKIDCNDKLVIYDGAHAIGKFMESISCDKTGAHVGQNGVIYSQTNYVTLKYVTDSWGTDENGFKMIITAFRDASYGCHNGFQCSTDTCIDNDLVCDNIHHCVDGADERHSEFCASLGLPGWMGLDKSAAIAIVLGCILLTTALATAYKLYHCRRNRDLRNDEMRTANTGQYHVGPPNMKHVNGVPGSGSTTATSVSLGHYKGDQYRRTAMYHHSNGNGLNGHGITESSNMLISMAAPGNSGNERRPADGRGYNKSFWHNLQLRHFWLPL